MDLVFNRTKKIPSKSWGQECSLCSSRHGVPIECSARGCKTAYHTTCAIRGKLKMQAIFGKNFKGGIKLRSYCKQHSPESRENDEVFSQNDRIDSNGVKEIDMTNLADDRLQESSEELDYFWKYVDINEVHKSIASNYARTKKMNLSSQSSNHDFGKTSPKKSNQSSVKKSESAKALSQEERSPNIKAGSGKHIESEVDPLMLDLIYRYWILLRTANNGQSLIKFSPSALKEKEFEQRKSIMKLRIELERVRNLSYMIGKREKLKASWLKTHHNIIKRTFSVINELNPVPETTYPMDCSNPSNVISDINHTPTTHHNNLPVVKKSHQAQLPNGMFDESDQLINDLITCDQIYELNNPTNSNYSNLPYSERCTLERRRTLSLVRRINRQFKSISNEPSINPYAKSYLASIRSDSPMSSNQVSSTVAKFFKFR